MRLYALVIFVSLLPLMSIFATADFPHTQDGLVHLPRIAAYHKALLDGQLPVRWAGDLNYGYGMPLFNFIYHFPYILSSLLLFAGLTLAGAFKVALALSFVLSGVFMLAFTKAFFEDGKKALLVTIFYQFAPFRLVEVLIRGSFGEVYTYAFLPLALFGLTRFFKKEAFRWFFLAAFATFLLIITHNSVSLLFFGLLASFVFSFAKNRRLLLLGSAALLVGLTLASFYWIPAVLEHKFTHGNLFMRYVYRDHFPSLSSLFIPNVTNSRAFRDGDVPMQIGLFHTVAIAAGAFIVLRRRVNAQIKRTIFFPLTLVAFSLFFMQPVSTVVWEHVSFLRQFQFPWRFLSLVCFATAMLSVSFLSLSFLRKRRMAYAALLFLAVFSTIVYWRPPLGYDKTLNESSFWNFPLTTTYYGETDVIWSAGPANAYPKRRVDIIAGKGTIGSFTKKSNVHAFVVDAETEVSIVDRTQYFPGWRAYVDGRPALIQFQDPNSRGLIVFPVPKGIHSVSVVLEGSKVRLFADLLTLLGFAGLFVAGVVTIRKRYA